jgi:hypothetical protein
MHRTPRVQRKGRSVLAATMTVLIVLLAVIVGLVALAGCSSSSNGKASPAPSHSASTGPSSVTTPVASAGTSSPAGPVIAEQKNLAVPNQTGDSMTVGVRSLTVDPGGKTMTLRLEFTPQFTSKPDQDVTLGDLLPGTYVRPALLDRVHLKRYDVIAATDQNGFLESPSGTGAPNGTPFEAWFVYAAPQDQVSSLELSVLDSWPPFTGIPVQR